MASFFFAGIRDRRRFSFGFGLITLEEGKLKTCIFGVYI